MPSSKSINELLAASLPFTVFHDLIDTTKWGVEDSDDNFSIPPGMTKSAAEDVADAFNSFRMTIDELQKANAAYAESNTDLIAQKSEAEELARSFEGEANQLREIASSYRRVLNGRPAAWYWEDATGCFHMTLDRPEVEKMAAVVGCTPTALFAKHEDWSRFFDANVEDQLAESYQKYLDAVALYNERREVMKTKALGTMHIHEEYAAISKASREFDSLAVEIAKSLLDRKSEKTMMPIPQDKETLDQVASVMLQYGNAQQRAEAMDYIRETDRS